MIRLLPYCLPLIRRLRPRVRRHVARGAGVATVAKVAVVPVVVGLVCFMVPVWGGGVPVVPAPVTAARPLPSQSTFGFHGGSIYGGAVDLRDILVPAPGVPILPPGDLLIMERVQVAQSQPVSVPEPASVSLFAAALVLMGVVRRWV